MQKSNNPQFILNLKASEWVEVRSPEEIFATLDKDGRLDRLQFMPEMLQHCGRRYRVYKRADKTCEYTQGWSIRRITNAVHLDGVRCDGSGHDGCQASCLIFWKEAWLKRASSDVVTAETLQPISEAARQLVSICTADSIRAAASTVNIEGERLFACQATNVPEYTLRMSFWDPRQYIRDLKSGNLSTGLSGTSKSHRLLEFVLVFSRLVQATIVGFFNEVQARRQGDRYP